MRDPSKTGSFSSRTHERLVYRPAFKIKTVKVPIFDPELIFVKMECAEKNRKNGTNLGSSPDTGTVPNPSPFRGRWLFFLYRWLGRSVEQLIRQPDAERSMSGA
jgi:hypothetical protein